MIDQLAKIVYARIKFKLEFQEVFTLKREMFMQLRREFFRIAKHASIDKKEFSVALLAMLDPELSPDPYARRLFQKPSPPFIIMPPDIEETHVDSGESVGLNVIFMGNLNKYVALFSSLLQLLGQFGFYKGEGRFELVGVWGEDQTGNRLEIPVATSAINQLTVPQISLNWLVEEKMPYDRSIGLNFITPARLLSNNKPLFKPCIAGIFPFILRRVTSMLHAWGGIELTDEPQYLISSVAQIEVIFSDLHWQDWRTMNGDHLKQDLGGIVGSLILGRIESDEILTIILLAEILNVGKSAAYGCGHFNIDLSG